MGSFSGSGTLNVTDGGEIVSSFGGYVGYVANGMATVQGAGSKWTANEMYVGLQGGSGTLNVENGGEVSSVKGFVGTLSGSATATVTGAGSKWTNSENLTIGNGTLNVLAGGEVSSANAFVGTGNGSSGSVTVTGPGSKWNLQGVMFLGGDGNGSLNVQSGGEAITSIGSIIGFGNEGTTFANVTGVGSKWNAGELSVYRGNLTVGAGGEILSTNATIGPLSGNDDATVSVTEAESLLLAGYEGMKQREASIPPAGATRIPETLEYLIELYTVLDRPDEVQKFRELRDEYPQATDQSSVSSLSATRLLAGSQPLTTGGCLESF